MSKKFLDYDGLEYLWDKIKAAFVSDVKVAGTSVVSDGEANIPKTTFNKFGVVKVVPPTDPSHLYAGIEGQNVDIEVPVLNPSRVIARTQMPDASTSSKGAMSAEDKTKLDGIESGAQVNIMNAADKTKLDGIATGAEVNVQSDWNQSDSTADDYIKNKPTIPTVNVDDVQIDGTSIVSDGVANIPIADSSHYGVVKMSRETGSPQEDKINIRYGSGSSDYYSFPNISSETNMIKASYLPEATTSFKGAISAADKTKLDSIAEGADVKSDGIYPDLYAGRIISAGGESDSTPYTFRRAPSMGYAYNAEIDSLVGGTVAWNQLIRPYSNSSAWASDSGVTASYDDGVATVSSTVTNAGIYTRANVVGGHKYLSYGLVKSPTAYNNVSIGTSAIGYYAINISSSDVNKWLPVYGIGSPSTDGNPKFYWFINSGSAFSNVKFREPMLIDLTQALGTEIANYIYSLEQTTSGSGIAWLKSHGFFTKKYYDYDAGSLKSVKTSAHKTHEKNLYVGSPSFDGFQGLTEWTADGTYNKHPSMKNESGTSRLYKVFHLPVGTYTFSFTAKASVNNFDVFSNIDGGSSAILAVVERGNNATHTLSTSWERKSVVFDVVKEGNVCPSVARISSSNVGTIWVSEFQIEFGDTTTAYEPYGIHTYPLDSDLELRGIPKLDASNNLYYDGDTYASDGSVARKYGIVDLGTLNWTMYGRNRWGTTDLLNMKYVGNDTPFAGISDTYAIVNAYSLYNDESLNGMAFNDGAYLFVRNGSTTNTPTGYLVYELATPTTEQADPFEDTQSITPNGSEEYVDNRAVPIPVGHNTKYLADVIAGIEDEIATRLPSAPTTNGTYVLTATVSSGVATYSWVAES